MTSILDAPPPAPSGPRRRRWPMVLALLVAVPLVLIVAGLAALRTAAVRRALLSRAADAIESAAGGRLSAEVLELDPLAGTLRLRGLRYGVAGAPPFATAREATAVVSLRSLTSRTPLVRSIVLVEPRIDLGAPLPRPKVPREPRSDENPLGLPIEVARFEVRNGSVASGPISGALADRVTSWRIDGLGLTGRYRGGAGELTLDSGTLSVTRPGLPVTALALHARLRTEAKGTVTLEELSAKGAGLALEASGETALAKDPPVRGRVSLTGDLATLAPELETAGSATVKLALSGSVAAPAAEIVLDARGIERKEGALAVLTAKASATKERVELLELEALGAEGGALRGAGSYDIASGETRARLRAEAVPLDLAAPFVPRDLFERFALAGTRLDGTADVLLPSGARGTSQVRADLTWRRGEETLAALRADGAGAGGAIHADLALALLPGMVGTRTISATLSAASAKELASGRLERGRVNVDAPDLAALLARLHALWPALAPAPESLSAARGALAATADLSGDLRDPLVAAHAEWRPEAGASAVLEASGRPLRKDGTLTLTLASLPLSLARAGQAGRVSGRLDVAGNAASFTTHASLAATELDVPPLASAADEVRLEATVSADAKEVRLQTLQLTAGEKALRASGRADRREPFRNAAGSILATRPTPLLAEVGALFTAKDGVLDVTLPDVAMYGQTATLHAVVPLGTLARVPELAPKLTFLPPGLPTGAVTLEAHAPVLDSNALVAEADEKPKAHAVAGLDLSLRFDPAAPAGASGEATLSDLVIETDAAKVRAEAPIAVRLAGERLTLAPARLVGDRTELSLEADASLALAALRGGAGGPLVRSYRVAASGRADASLLEPFLVGGIARGEASLTATLAGAGEELSGRVRVSAPGASFFWPTPYASKLESPDLELTLAKDRVTIERGTATLNGGNVALSGAATTAGGLDLAAEFAGVRYVLAYGLRAELSGRLALRAPPKGARVLSGTVALERGLLERDVDLDREILTRFFAPPESEGTEASLLDTISLDLSVSTASGVRLRNNLADLHATWSALDVKGTLRNPVIKGRIDVDRGGVLYAYGQRFTIERASLVYAGDPTTDPRIDAVTTSALQGGASSPFAKDVASAADLSAVATGLAGYYGERVASRLGAALGFHAAARRADLVFGEVDPGARLTLARDLSRNAAFTFSLDLTNPQNQTYIVDLHGLRRLPTMTLQVFKNDFENWGGTFQQSLRLGGARRRGETGPVIQRITYTVPPAASASSPRIPHVSARTLKAAVLVQKGDPLPKDATFDIEVEVEAALRDAGYPDARVTATTKDSAAKPGRVDLDVAIAPGEHAVFRFEGETPPAASRRAISSLYRGDFYEAASLEEMRRRTERVFRALGHPAPKVTVTAVREGSERRVTVTSEAGPRVEIGPPRFVGVTDEEAALLAPRFPGPVERAELAAPGGTDAARDAERRLLASLAGIGYPRARVVSRELSQDGALVVAVEKGGASRVASVEITGLIEADRDALLERIPVRAGDVARSDLIAKGTLAIEDELLARGYDDVRVTTSVGPASPEDPPPLGVVYDVDPGVAYRLVAVRFDRGGSASRALLRRVAALRLGSIYRRGEVDDARARLLGIGIFDAVRAEAVKRPDGKAEVVFSLEEAPRFDLAYGVRWESSVGASGVVDIVDHDLFGRAITVGLRGVYEPRDERARLFVGASDLFGTRFAVEAFLDVRRQTETLESGNDLRTDTIQATLQLSRPLGRFTTARLYARYRKTRLLELTSEEDPFAVNTALRYPFLGVEAVYDDRDDPFLPTKGVFASVDVEGTGGFLTSDFAYGRVYGQVNVYRPLAMFAGRRVTWAQSVRVGYARAFAGQELLPDRNVRFSTGGEYSVRGYARDSLTAVEEATAVRPGGAKLLVLNEELRMPLFSRFTGVVFFDAGEVWRATAGEVGSGFKKALGLGLRASTPVGLLRFDVARPLDRREGDKSFRLYFGFGSTF